MKKPKWLTRSVQVFSKYINKLPIQDDFGILRLVYLIHIIFDLYSYIGVRVITPPFKSFGGKGLKLF